MKYWFNRTKALFGSYLVLLIAILLGSCLRERQECYFGQTVDFELEKQGKLTDSRTREIWANAEMLCGRKDFLLYKLGLTFHPHYISVENNNKFLSVFIPKGLFGPITGAQWSFPLNPADEYYLMYKLKFEEGFNFVKGGKLPGLAGGTANSGGNTPSGFDGWSARMMFWENGKLSFYVYCANQSSRWGERLFFKDINGDTLRLKTNEWHSITQRISMNTLGASNGIMQCWVNNQEVFYTDTILFRKTDSIKIDQIFYSVFMGGDDLSWASPKDQHIFLDDFKVSSKKEY